MGDPGPQAFSAYIVDGGRMIQSDRPCFGLSRGVWQFEIWKVVELLLHESPRGKAETTVP